MNSFGVGEGELGRSQTFDVWADRHKSELFGSGDRRVWASAVSLERPAAHTGRVRPISFGYHLRRGAPVRIAPDVVQHLLNKLPPQLRINPLGYLGGLLTFTLI